MVDRTVRSRPRVRVAEPTSHQPRTSARSGRGLRSVTSRRGDVERGSPPPLPPRCQSSDATETAGMRRRFVTATPFGGKRIDHRTLLTARCVVVLRPGPSQMPNLLRTRSGDALLANRGLMDRALCGTSLPVGPGGDEVGSLLCGGCAAGMSGRQLLASRSTIRTTARVYGPQAAGRGLWLRIVSVAFSSTSSCRSWVNCSGPSSVSRSASISRTA